MSLCLLRQCGAVCVYVLAEGVFWNRTTCAPGALTHTHTLHSGLMRWNKTAKITGTGPPLFFLYYIFHLSTTFLEPQTGFWLFSTAFLSSFVFFFFFLPFLLLRTEWKSECVCVCASLEEKRSRWVAVPDHLHLVLSIFTSYDVQCTEREGKGLYFSIYPFHSILPSRFFFFLLFLNIFCL